MRGRAVPPHFYKTAGMKMLNFGDPEMLRALTAMAVPEFDQLPFGAIAMTLGGIVTAYNRYEADMAGFAPENVLGKHFFRDIAPCTNNAIVAGIYDLTDEVDEFVPYIFTLRGEIEEVRLRMLKDAKLGKQFLLVERL